MDKFKIRSGEFIGIIIPGVVLFSNLYLFFCETVNSIAKIDFTNITFKEDVIIFLLFLIFSYIAGVILRLFSPDLPDRLSAILRLIYTYIKSGYNAAVKKQEGEKKRDTFPLRGYYENFPYLDWFMEYVSKSITEVNNFYQAYFKKNGALSEKPVKNKRIIIRLIINSLIVVLTVLLFAVRDVPVKILLLGAILALLMVFFIKGILAHREIDDYKTGYPDKKSIKDFFNYCKLTVCEKSSTLADEVFFAEGLSRMVSGLFYAILCSLLIILFIIAIYQDTGIKIKMDQSLVQIIINAVFLIIITWGVHHVRVKEAATVFTAFAIVNKKNK